VNNTLRFPSAHPFCSDYEVLIEVPTRLLFQFQSGNNVGFFETNRPPEQGIGRFMGGLSRDKLTLREVMDLQLMSAYRPYPATMWSAPIGGSALPQQISDIGRLPEATHRT
jgi:hypothetical protein